MKSLKFYVLVTIAVLFAIGCQRNSEKEDITPADKQEIVRLTLELALVDQEIPDYELLTESGNELVLSTEQIENVDLWEMKDFRIILLSPEEIQAKANSEGDFLYLAFSSFEPVSPDKVELGFGSHWVTAANSNTGYLSGGGLELVFTRSASGWTSEILAVWIS